MTGEDFLEGYDGQSADELIAMESTHRLDSLVLAFESAIDARKDAGEALSGAERVVLAVEALEREVNNGGYSQFFYNSSVEYTPEIVDALNAIGCPDVAKLTQEAIDSLGVDSLDPDVIYERALPPDDELDERLNALDERYYQLEEDVAGRLFAFIKDHRDQFRW
jgi:hypothetical protein